MQGHIEEKIEELRNEMAVIAGQTGSLTHPRVVTVSQELDKIILLAQKMLFTPIPFLLYDE